MRHVAGPMADPLLLGTTLLRVALVGSLLVGVRRRNAAIGANALVALAATFLPALVEYALYASRGVSASVEGLVPFWIASAGFLHMLGMAGLYENEATWWWDHLTHLVSSALVAATFYGAIHGVALASPELQPPAAAVAGLTLLLTIAVGVVWELIELAIHRSSDELGVESVLIPYGRRDTALDLVFDVVGAVVVVGLDVRILVPVVLEVPRLTRWLLVAAGVYVVVGSIGSALVLLVVGESGFGSE